ncbi:hypothetical protein [Bacillus cereus group sp. BfR-BA-02730]|uniref:hypothetical protein n=1 Tax=Bacillus cereus group sp. BfR-BA-02730 TaxID=3094893 RepID=UPI0029C30BDA|nr:hypothetical protein [Bacillus cereus group sp. BfR-BA-02730]MDX5813390.1 hypothetical protein [Bacillus cereus group sp. BfR-BA-02730]
MDAVEVFGDECGKILNEIGDLCSARIAEQVNEFSEATDGEDPLQVVLRGHLYVEYELERLLRKNMENPDSILTDRFMFMNKVNLAIALGLLPKSRKIAYKKLNDLRNKYAHRLRFEVEHKDLNDFISVMDKEVRDEVFADEFGNKVHEEIYEKDIRLKLRHAILALWVDCSRIVYLKEIQKYQINMDIAVELKKRFDGDGNDKEYEDLKKARLLALKERMEFIMSE